MWLFLFLLFSVCVFGEEEVVVKLIAGTDPMEFGRTHGLVYQRSLDFLPDENLFLYKTSNKRQAHLLRDAPEVKWVEPQEARVQYKRTADPLYEEQWHLHTHPFSVSADAISNLTGKGVVIAIVDDGLEHTHPDLKANYDRAHSWDFNDNDRDPMPMNPRDGHGTSAAGVAAAVKNNGHCGRGVAPEAKLVGLRTIAAGVTDATEAEALSYNGIGVVDIYSCSWGPADDGVGMLGPAYLTRQTLALYAGQMRGRMGKGTIYVWAAGNGQDNGDSCAFDGYASSQYVNAIGAVDHTGVQSWYSEGCAALMAVTPSSGAMKGITTVDLAGSAGYDPSECTSTFGGTSSAAPLAAGVIALLLEARPDLTWRDVKHIIAKGAVPIQEQDPVSGWHTNKRGYTHSNRYGFGLLRVPSLVAIAKDHVLVPPRFLFYKAPYKTFPTAIETYIPCRQTQEVSGSNITFIEHVTLFVAISHPRRGHLQIALISPEGTHSVLAQPRPKDNKVDYPSDGWLFTSVHFWGEEEVNGNWTIVVNDENERTTGRGHLNAFQLTVYGY
jgi:subtilisin family serine protease